MSIKIHNGYRVRTSDPDAFLTRVEAAVAPVRDFLDATLYAEIVADLIDRRDHGQPTGLAAGKPVRAAALSEFTQRVHAGQPGYVWNHPHSFDLDYGYAPGTEDDPDRWLYVLVHNQREAYDAAFTALPGVEPYDYTTSTDSYKQRGISDREWAQRRANWQFLIDARRIADVMTRWTYRECSSLDESYALRDEVILEHLPTRDERARAIARDRAVAEHFAGATDIASRIGEVFEVLASPRVGELATEIAPTLRLITAADLNTLHVTR